jgi:hypothetical protein
MKTKEEIEKLAEQLYPISPNPNQIIEGFERAAFKRGYILCQEDMKIVISEWQLCPMCLGEGQIPNNGTSSSAFRICPVCNGNRTLIKPYVNKQDNEK